MKNEFNELIDESIDAAIEYLSDNDVGICIACDNIPTELDSIYYYLQEAWNYFSWQYFTPNALDYNYYFGAYSNSLVLTYPEDFNDYKENKKHRLLALEMFRIYLKGEL